MISILFFILGAALGSFSHVLAERLHLKKDWVRGRSACNACGNTLQIRDLVPVASWLLLRGRCRFCGASIPRQLFLAEIMMGIWVVGSYLFWPLPLTTIGEGMIFVLWLAILTVASALFWYDANHFILPNPLVYTHLGLVVLFIASRSLLMSDAWDFVFSSGVAAAVFFSFFWCLHTISKGKWLGYGDVRLSIALGLLAGGLLEVWLLVFTASVVGLLAALPSVVQGKSMSKLKIPFGPMLLTASIMVVLFAPELLAWFGTTTSL